MAERERILRAVLRERVLGERLRHLAAQLADVVAFRGDPSANTALLEKGPALIMMGGKRIDRAALST